MCHVTVLEFFIEHVEPEEFEGKNVLEVGSKYVNGSIRPFIERFLKPQKYVGVDVEPGRFVDLVLPAEEIVEYFGKESFDVVIATELLEHVKDWKLVVTNLKKILKRGGYIYVTTRSVGFPYHAYPSDYWRYSLQDMKRIFADFQIIIIKNDELYPGVFLKAKKPLVYYPCDLDDVSLYSMVLGKKTNTIPDFEEMPALRKIKFIITDNLIKRAKLLIYKTK